MIVHPDLGVFWAGMPTPEWTLCAFASHRERTTYIGQLEAIAALAPLLSMPTSSFFAGRSVTHYIDNQGALYSFINGRSADPDINRIVFLYGMIASRLSCRPWFDYVSSGSNVADLPTRLSLLLTLSV